jgi:hypothetical protein
VGERGGGEDVLMREGEKKGGYSVKINLENPKFNVNLA